MLDNSNRLHIDKERMFFTSVPWEDLEAVPINSEQSSSDALDKKL